MIEVDWWEVRTSADKIWLFFAGLAILVLAVITYPLWRPAVWLRGALRRRRKG